ncbi:MAG: UPF0280 family protein [Candidatus Latescibacteria bacterium]|nr:UPF0280 family protein [Candidatus Latescibacterota bacterium]
MDRSTSYEPRTYRNICSGGDLLSFRVVLSETDLWIRAERDLSGEAFRATRAVRRKIEGYIRRDEKFLRILKPYPAAEDAPQVVRKMAQAAVKAGVGPMAAVAGAVAEYVGRDLLRFSDQVIVENGGDIFIRSRHPRNVGVFAGASLLSNKLALRIAPEQTPLGICTSSGTVGPSKSFGRTDAVVVLSRSTALADAVATAAGNRVESPGDIEGAMDFALTIKGVMGIVIVLGNRLGVRGEVILNPFQNAQSEIRNPK